VATHALMVEGNPSEHITRVAERLRCDLIVLATSGRTGLLRVLLGSSMAERVIRRARCPVLAYRASQPQSVHERVGTPQKVAAGPPSSPERSSPLLRRYSQDWSATSTTCLTIPFVFQPWLGSLFAYSGHPKFDCNSLGR
jgi:hypothetical protein